MQNNMTLVNYTDCANRKITKQAMDRDVLIPGRRITTIENSISFRVTEYYFKPSDKFSLETAGRLP